MYTLIMRLVMLCLVLLLTGSVCSSLVCAQTPQTIFDDQVYEYDDGHVYIIVEVETMPFSHNVHNVDARFIRHDSNEPVSYLCSVDIWDDRDPKHVKQSMRLEEGISCQHFWLFPREDWDISRFHVNATVTRI